MEQQGKALVIRAPDKSMIPADLPTPHPVAEPGRFYTQNEEFFLRMAHEIEVPSFAIHHDVHRKTPTPEYRKKIEGVVRDVAALCQGIFNGLSWYFDPTEHLRPGFFTLLKADGQIYLYLLKIDLAPRRAMVRIVKEGDNDHTPVYRTSALFVEAEFIPIAQAQKTGEDLYLTPKQTVSETWIGESGRGYFVQGIWIDRELTKFFSKLFMPEKKRLYPYFPFNCRYRAVCASVVDYSPDGRRTFLAHLHRARTYIETHIQKIEEALRGEPFSEDLEIFRHLRAHLPHSPVLTDLEKHEIHAYLNAEDMKEYELIIRT